MLSKFNQQRTLSDNIRLGVLTGFSAGMVNVASVIVFFAFTSNVTGHFAILAQEISKGNWYEAAIAFVWIACFFAGNFMANLFVVHGKGRIGRYFGRAVPVMMEIAGLIFIGIYLQSFYRETLRETEFLVAVLLFAMGLQNGLTAGISGFAVKTTHLTGLVTDLGVLFSMFTRKAYRNRKPLVDRARLQVSILLAYVSGGIISGVLYYRMYAAVFFIVSGFLALVIMYDAYVYFLHYVVNGRQPYMRREIRIDSAAKGNDGKKTRAAMDLR
jgi:uncharacterized membrane protein YoaK (UPF0700 family)